MLSVIEKKEEFKGKVVISVISPRKEVICKETLQSVFNLDTEGFNHALLFISDNMEGVKGDANLCYCLSQARKFLLENDYTYLLNVESDIVPPRYALKFLIETMNKYKCDAVTGLVPERPSKVGTDKFIVEMEWNGNPDASEKIRKLEPFELQGHGGLACVLFKREVFEELDFEHVFPCDFTFWGKFHERDFKLFCDPRVICGHVDRDGRVIRGLGYTYIFWLTHVENNESRGLKWYYGLPYNWWWGMDKYEFFKNLREHLKLEEYHEYLWYLF